MEIVGFCSKGPLGLDEWFAWGPILLGLVSYKYSLGLFFVKKKEFKQGNTESIVRGEALRARLSSIGGESRLSVRGFAFVTSCSISCIVKWSGTFITLWK